MMHNPYYQLLALIRAQQTGAGAQCFLARLQQVTPPIFVAEGANVQPDLVPAGLTLTEADKNGEFLCLWLDGRVLILGRMTVPDWR